MNEITAPFELIADSPAFGGDSVGRSPDGRAVFVPFMLPGERALVRVVGRRPRYDRAELVRLISSVPGRRSAPCSVYGRCGGCNLQHAQIELQRALKWQVTAELDRRIGGFSAGEPEEHGAVDGAGGLALVGGAEFGYRNRVRLRAAGHDSWGYLRRNSREVVPVLNCPIAVAEVNAFLSSNSAGRASEQADEQVLFGAGGVCFSGGHAVVQVVGREFRFPVSAFFQSNLELTERLIRNEVLPMEGERALDLYAGCGLFSVFLSERFAELSAVESHADSVKALIQNLGAGNGRQCIHAKVEDWCRTTKAREPYDTVVVDPPRAGLSRVVREYLQRCTTPRLVYISCDPASSARDIGMLVRGGYRLESRRIYDFYPQTSHIETVSVLRWSGSPESGKT